MPDSFESDFDFTFDVLAGFFGQTRIQRTLETIEDIGISGWEKWWQIELALYLSDHPEVSDWEMEESFYTDLRRQQKQNAIAVDLCFRRKKHSRDAMLVLELKQNQDWKKCIDSTSA